MDKFRALQYFLAAARFGSLNAAAREMDVSVPAISRLISTLEINLGVTLFERSPNGLSLTADGSNYLQMCSPHIEGLTEADEALKGGADHPKGTLVIGAPPTISQHCILPALQDFHEKYPEIEIDLRSVDKPTSTHANEAELLILVGWPRLPDMIYRHLAYSRMLICASPDYWEKYGTPTSPEDLKNHQCLLFRDQDGTIMDSWQHQRSGERQNVTVNGWMVSNQRDVLLDGAINGLGVVRVMDISVRKPLESGKLIPVLLDWESTQAPPVSLFYRSKQRKLKRVRLAVDFMVKVFEDVEASRSPEMSIQVKPEKPHWYRRRHQRASATPLLNST